MVDNVLTYTYNAAGDRTQRDELDDSVAQWRYDRARQLTYEQRTRTVAFQVTYAYDAVGNRAVEIDGGARTTYTFDAANQLTKTESVAGVSADHPFTDRLSFETYDASVPGGCVFYQRRAGHLHAGWRLIIRKRTVGIYADVAR